MQIYYHNSLNCLKSCEPVDSLTAIVPCSSVTFSNLIKKLDIKFLSLKTLNIFVRSVSKLQQYLSVGIITPFIMLKFSLLKSLEVITVPKFYLLNSCCIN